MELRHITEEEWRNGLWVEVTTHKDEFPVYRKLPGEKRHPQDGYSYTQDALGNWVPRTTPVDDGESE